jgi:hypothetical protein
MVGDGPSPLEIEILRLLDLLRGLGSRVGFLGRLLRLALELVDPTRQLLDLPLLLPDDVHQLRIALRERRAG